MRFHNDRLNVEDAALTLVSILQMAKHIHRLFHQINDPSWQKDGGSILEEICVGKEGAADFIDFVLDEFNNALT